MSEYYETYHAPVCDYCVHGTGQPDRCKGQRTDKLPAELNILIHRLVDMGFDLHHATCYTAAAAVGMDKNSCRLSVQIEFNKHYPATLFDGLPDGWRYYTETASLDHTPLQVLMFAAYGLCWRNYTDFITQIKQVAQGLVGYLDTKDVGSTRSVLTLLYN